MAFSSTSQIGRAVAAMRGATAENNPFTSPEGADAIPDPAARTRAGAASVDLLHGLGALIEVTFEQKGDGTEAAEEIAGMLRGLASAIEFTAISDEREAGL